MNRIKGITIEIGGSTVELQTALKDVDKQTRATASRLQDVNRLLKFDPKNTDLLRQKHALLAEQIENTKTRLDALKEAERQAAADPNFKADSLLDLRREIEATTQKLQILKTENSKITQIGAGFKAAGDGLKSTGASIDAAGKKASVLSAGIAGLGIAAVSAAASFDEQMAKVKAISGATGAEFEALKARAEELGGGQWSSTEAGQALEYMAMAGWDVQSMMTGLPVVMDLATASGEELGTTSDILTDALTAFGLSAEDAAGFADVLSTASTKSNTTVGLLGESFKYVGPLMGSMGYSVQDTALALGLMANAGIKGSQAGTSLRQMLTNMAKPTAQVQQAMDALGLSMTNADGTAKTLGEIMTDLRTAFKNNGLDSLEFVQGLEKLNTQLSSGKITQEEYAQAVEELAASTGASNTEIAAQYAATLAGQEGLSGLLSIVNASDEDFSKLSDAVNDCENATADMAETMGDTAAGDFKELKNTAGEIAREFGEVLVPILREIMDFMRPIFETIKNMAPEQKKLLVQILALVAAIGPILVIIGQIAIGLGALSSLFGMICTPVGLATVAVAALVGGLTCLWATNEDFRNWCIGVRDGLNDMLMDFANFTGSIPGAVGKAFSDFATMWGRWMSNIAQGFQNFGSKIWNVITFPINLIQSAWDGFYNWFSGLIAKIASMIDSLKSKFSGVGDFFGGVGDFFGGIGSAIGWNAEGGIMTKPTIFGANAGVLQGGGEAGPEAVLPLSKLYTEVDRIVASRVPSMDRVENLLSRIAAKDMSFNVDSRELATATAGATDRALAVRQRQGGRR